MARDEQLKQRWDVLVEKISTRFGDGEKLDLEAIIYLIGVQELGKIKKNIKKTIKSI